MFYVRIGCLPTKMCSNFGYRITKLFTNVLFHKQLLCIFFANINRKLAFASISVQMLLLFTTHLHECVAAAYVLHTFTTHLHEWVAAAT